MDNTFGEKSRQNFRIEIENKNTIIKEITDFDLEQTLECGQCFRFYKQKIMLWLLLISCFILNKMVIN